VQTDDPQTPSDAPPVQGNDVHADFGPGEIMDPNELDPTVGADGSPTVAPVQGDDAQPPNDVPSNQISIHDFDPGGTWDPDALDPIIGADGTQLAGSSDGTPGNNQAQNKQFSAVVRILGLDQDQAKELHRAISGQNYGFQQILKIGGEMFNK
jgi:hypothetical protein